MSAHRTGPGERVDALALWDDNGKGRITCAEGRRHGIAPVPRGHFASRYMRAGMETASSASSGDDQLTIASGPDVPAEAR